MKGICFMAEGWSGRQFIDRIEREGPAGTLKFLSTFANDLVEWVPGPEEPGEGSFRRGSLELRWRPRTGVVYVLAGAPAGRGSGISYGRVHPRSAAGFPAQPIASRAELDAYLSTTEIQCLECGAWFRAIKDAHLHGHGLTVGEYRDKFNLPADRGLVCPETAENHREALFNRIENGDLIPPKEWMRTLRRPMEKKRRPAPGYLVRRKEA